MTLREAIDTLDSVIPHPQNRMVDHEHLPIALAWQEVKAVLFDAAVVTKYMESNAMIKRGISILPEDCQAYADGYLYGAYTQTPDGETHIVEFFKTKAEIQPFVNANPQYGTKKGGENKS